MGIMKCKKCNKEYFEKYWDEAGWCDECEDNKVPNAETIESIENIENGVELHKVANIQELFKELEELDVNEILIQECKDMNRCIETKMAAIKSKIDTMSEKELKETLDSLMFTTFLVVSSSDQLIEYLEEEYENES